MAARAKPRRLQPVACMPSGIIAASPANSHYAETSLYAVPGREATAGFSQRLDGTMPAEPMEARPEDVARGRRRKLAAILSADAVGFSRQMHRDEAGTHARLRSCREIIDRLVT